MKPSPWASALLGGLLALPAAAEGLPALGGVALGMPRDAAIAAAGPTALVGPLCGGNEGVMFDLAEPGGPAQAMAMFEAGRVSEMALMLGDPGASFPATACEALAAERFAALAGAAPTPAVAMAAGLREASWTRGASANGELRAVSRWSERSGACYVTLHWLAAGVRRVIPGN